MFQINNKQKNDKYRYIKHGILKLITDILNCRYTQLRFYALFPSFVKTHLMRATEIDFHAGTLFYIFCRLSITTKYELSTNDSGKCVQSS